MKTPEQLAESLLDESPISSVDGVLLNLDDAMDYLHKVDKALGTSFSDGVRTLYSAVDALPNNASLYSAVLKIAQDIRARAADIFRAMPHVQNPWHELQQLNSRGTSIVKRA